MDSVETGNGFPSKLGTRYSVQSKLGDRIQLRKQTWDQMIRAKANLGTGSYLIGTFHRQIFCHSTVGAVRAACLSARTDLSSCIAFMQALCSRLDAGLVQVELGPGY